MSDVDRPISLVILGIVAVVMIAGTFTLLMTGRPVPEPVWVAWGVIITALFGHGSFLAQSAAHTAIIGDLMEAVQAGASAATPTTTTTTNAHPARSGNATSSTEEVKH